jgi:hypothetical protein
MEIRPQSREKFKRQGVFLTRLHLKMNNMDPSEKNEMVMWLAEEERESKRQELLQFRWMLAVTIVAAAAAIIAAWPVVTGWIAK